MKFKSDKQRKAVMSNLNNNSSSSVVSSTSGLTRKNPNENKMLQSGYTYKEKIKALKLALDDADRRYEIAVSRMSDITKRVHELDEQRNLALRKQHLANEIKNNPNPNLKKEYDKIHADDGDIQVYEEVIQGYRSMSRRKNQGIKIST